MTLRCKVGDLAYIHKSDAGNQGKIVSCLRLHPPGHGGLFASYGPVWEIDADVVLVNPAFTIVTNLFPDLYLTPISPGELIPEDAAKEEEECTA